MSVIYRTCEGDKDDECPEVEFSRGTWRKKKLYVPTLEEIAEHDLGIPYTMDNEGGGNSSCAS